MLQYEHSWLKQMLALQLLSVFFKFLNLWMESWLVAMWMQAKYSNFETVVLCMMGALNKYIYWSECYADVSLKG